MTKEQIAHFEKIVASQLERIEKMKAECDFIDYSALDTLIIGICGGDGIGPEITAQGERVRCQVAFCRYFQRAYEQRYVCRGFYF